METTNAVNTSSHAGAPPGPDVLFRNWQQIGARMMRAQERVLHGVASAARLEMR